MQVYASFYGNWPVVPDGCSTLHSTPPFDIQHVNVSDATEPEDGAQVQVLTKSYHRPA
jgi:hypothetical protein